MNRLFRYFLLLIIMVTGFMGCVSDRGLMTHEELKMVTLRDGVYEGKHMKGPFLGARSIVTIEEGRLKKIEVPTCVIFFTKFWCKKRAKKLPEEIIQKQSIKIDALSCATYSSLSLMQSVQNAVNKAIVGEQTY
jgi:uncharacterized protein with FMN-binding domain